jgi:hypothetical protein
MHTACQGGCAGSQETAVAARLSSARHDVRVGGGPRDLSSTPRVSDKSPEAEAADRRLAVLTRALHLDPNDDEALRELWRADRRLSELIVNSKPELARRLEHGRRVPPGPGGRRTATQAALWHARAEYELIGELIDVYVDDQWLMTVPLTILQGDPSPE